MPASRPVDLIRAGAPTAIAQAASPDALPKPRLTWRGVALAALFWVLYTVLYAAVIARGVEIPFVWALMGQGVLNPVLALLSVPVWLLVIRAMDEAGWAWKIAAHVVFAPVYAWLGLAGTLLIIRLLVGSEAVGEIGSNGQWVLYSNLTVYVLQFAIYHTIRSVQRFQIRERQAVALQAMAQEQELAALKAQVNPHFLFNTLNSISAMVKQDPEEARAMIARLAEMLRYALDSSKRDLVPLRQEVAFARAYLELEARRFSDRLRVHYDIDPDALEARVPPVVLQPLLENALKHGIGPSEAGGAVTLRIAAVGGRLQVTVEDTGVGLNGQAPDDAAPSGIGLANTDARLRLCFGPEAALHTASQPQGFKVWFSIPEIKEGEAR